jgi:hypothetical protein
MSGGTRSCGAQQVHHDFLADRLRGERVPDAPEAGADVRMARQDNDADAQRLQRLRTGPSGVAVGEGEIDDREIGVEFGRAAERFLRIVKHPANYVASLHDDRSEVGGE